MGVSVEGKFARYYDLFFDGILKSIRQKQLEMIKKYQCKQIIDLGCGTGAQARLLSSHGYQVTGVDASPQMLRVAQQKNKHNTRFILEDITNKLLSSEQFDCALISLVLHPNPFSTIQDILAQAKRITQNHGIIIITDYDIGSQFKGMIANKFIRIIESCANPTHRKNYYGFMQQGGLEQIIIQYKYTILERYLFFNGALKTCVIK